MDEGTDDYFNPVGWSGDTFVYEVDRGDIPYDQAAKYALKSYNASMGQLSTLDQTSMTTYGSWFTAYQSFSQSMQIVNSKVLYSKSWQYDSAAMPDTSPLNNTVNNIMSVNVDGSAKKDLQDIPITDLSYTNTNSIQTGPQTIYFQANNYQGSATSNGDTYYKYDNGTITQPNNFTDYSYGQLVYGYVGLSPDGSKSLYGENRNGQTVVLIGDSEGNSQKQIASLSSDYSVAGWYNNNYILLTYKNNEYDIISINGLANGAQPLKIT